MTRGDDFRLKYRSGPEASLVPFVVGYRQCGVPPAAHRGLPSPYLTMILTLDEPCHVARHPDPAQAPGSFATLIGGLHTRHALITHDGAQSGLQVALSPLAARAVLGLPAGALASIDVPGPDLLGPGVRVLQERLREAPDWHTRFALLEDFLLPRLAAHPRRGGVGAEVRHAWRELVRTGGGVSVAALAREVGYSPRRLRALFDREIGLSPKQAARVVRFDATRRALPRYAGSGRTADLAARAGYADQSHFNRDFRDFSGQTPGQWLRTEVFPAGTDDRSVHVDPGAGERCSTYDLHAPAPHHLADPAQPRRPPTDRLPGEGLRSGRGGGPRRG